MSSTSPGSAAACARWTCPTPISPRKSGYYVPEPGKGQNSVQSNDVYHDENGLLYLIDRLDGLEILEPQV